MSNLLNKSNHPVEVKKIFVEIWTLRDEIEAAIAKKILAQSEVDGADVDIDDIREFYTTMLQGKQASSDEEEEENDTEDSNLDSSGNPLDDDALAMMAALNGEESSEDATEENAEEEPADEDQESPAEEEIDPEDEASKLAAQMLSEQGLGETNSSDDDLAAEMAAQMLADQGGSEAPKEEEKAKGPFKRVRPNPDKIINGFVLLSDIQMDQIMLFTRQDFIRGQNIIIRFIIPRSFSQITEVLNTVHISRNSKIISQTKPSHRIQCKFLFKFENERDLLREFLKSVEPEIPVPPKKLKKPDSDDDDDDFDDLGF